MKTMKLFLTFALVSLFQMANAQTDVHATGVLTNTNGAPINVWLTLFSSNGSVTSATVVTNPNGFYSHIFTTFAGDSGSVYMQVADCNFDSIFEWKPYELLAGDTLANFTTFDYCPTTTGCQAFFSLNQSLDTNGTAIASQVSVTDGSTNTGTGNLTYTWNFGDGNTATGSALSHTYIGNGPYVLCLTIDNGQGCTDTYCDTVSVDSLGMLESEGFTLNIGIEPILSVEKIDFSSAVSIYPNPAVNFINIEFNTGNKMLNSITMYDLSGKVVFAESNNNSSGNMTTINTNGIAPGTYLIQMLFDQELHNAKVIIK